MCSKRPKRIAANGQKESQQTAKKNRSKRQKKIAANSRNEPQHFKLKQADDRQKLMIQLSIKKNKLKNIINLMNFIAIR
jgi:hypothetical protein